MSFSKILAIAGAITYASSAAAHGYVQGIVVDGSYYGGYMVTQYPYTAQPPELIAWSTKATDLGFVDGSGYTSPDIICHKGAEPGAQSAKVAAGGTVELQWTAWPESHKGPVIDYLAACDGDCSSVDKTALKFFKIDESGLIDGNGAGTWASDTLIKNNNSWTVTIPSTIASGNYVLRHEIIALHSAGNKDGAQNYPQCINLEVTGSGTENPAGTLGTALYTDTDPGLLVNIYQGLSNYSIPGPALYSGNSDNAGSLNPTTTPSIQNAAAAPSTSTASVVTDSSSATQTASVAATTPASTSAVTASPAPDTGSDVTKYLDSMSSDEVLTLVRGTLSWLVSNKKHARDLSH
ncbi:hypothetical protein VTN00DRAFT_10021 [Thermoascus crustaceus]|uniref:uncharacterized protein n=1 Tax=Thermoascus crustaceus TaxID=5088 RepID=UPI000211DDC2